MKPLQILFLFATIACIPQAWAQAQSGSLAFGGTGCPQGTASFMGQELVLDQFVVETSAARGLDRKTCSLTLPVAVDPGYQVGIVMPKVDISADLISAQSSLQLNAEIFLAGSTGPKLKKKLVGPMIRDITLQTREKIVWGDCGVSVNLRMNLSAVLQSQNGESSAVQLNSIHRRPGSLFLVRKCQ